MRGGGWGGGKLNKKRKFELNKEEREEMIMNTDKLKFGVNNSPKLTK